MADDPPKKVGPFPFDEAIATLRDKVRLPTKTWTDVYEGMHARAFVVAGANKAAIVEDFWKSTVEAIERGETKADFRKRFDKIVETHGWSHNGGAGWRSRIIYNTNLKMAHAAGRWSQVQRVKHRRPYLQYVSALLSTTRPAHRGWHGTVLPVDDPFWRTHYPPNDWECHCSVRSISKGDLEREGLKVAQAPAVEWETRTIKRSDGTVGTARVPKDVGTGFGYNVGEAAWGRGEQLVAMEKHGPFERLHVPGGSVPANVGDLKPETTATRPGPRAKDAADLPRVVRQALGGDAAIYTDPIGARVQVGQAFADHMAKEKPDGREAFLPYLKETVEDPAEIWIGFARSAISGRVVLRRRYVKLIADGKDRVLGLVADADGTTWSGFTFYPGDHRDLKNLRWGLRIFAK